MRFFGGTAVGDPTGYDDVDIIICQIGLELQNMSKYDYYINCQKLIPPIGKFHYTAFVDYIYEVTEGGRTRINIDFGETKGVTWEDAEKKMRRLSSYHRLCRWSLIIFRCCIL